MHGIIVRSCLLATLFWTSAVGAQVIPVSDTDIVVKGRHLDEAADATKTDVPLIEQPQAISVVTADLIRQQGVTRLADALRTVAGVSRSSTYGFFDAYTIRGYDAAYGSVYLDGLISEAGVGSNQELSGLERVEVLKGPASMLFGQAPLGGLVNMVSKRPRGDAFLNLSASTGSYGLAEGTVDANAPLNRSGTMLARLNMAYRDAGSFVDNAGQNRIYIAPALTWAPTDRTGITLLGRWQRDEDSPFSPLHAYGTVLPNRNGPVSIHFGVNNGGAQRAINNQDRKQIGYALRHDFSDAIAVAQTLRYTRRTTFWDRWFFAGDYLDNRIGADGQPVPGTGRTIGRYYYGPYRATNHDLAVDTRMTATIRTGGIAHGLLTGIDYRQSRERNAGDSDFDGSHNPLDLFAPDYSVPIRFQSAPYTGRQRSKQTGIYIQDHLRFGGAFTLTLGGRYDWAEANGQKDTALSPRVGATVDVIPGAVAYASWSKSFTPQLGSQRVIGLDAGGAPILDSVPPERGENVELGMKVAPAGATVTGMIALFQLTRANVSTPDPLYVNYVIVTGEQRSRGIEIEGQWHPVAGLSVNAAYAYLRAKVTADTVFRVGTPLPNVPRHNLNLFGRYVVQDGALRNLGFTAGFLYNSRRNGSLGAVDAAGRPLLRLPAYRIVDGGLSYDLGDWGLQLNVGNVLNKRFFPDSCCIQRVTPGQPRNWRLTVRRSL